MQMKKGGRDAQLGENNYINGLLFGGSNRRDEAGLRFRGASPHVFSSRLLYKLLGGSSPPSSGNRALRPGQNIWPQSTRRASPPGGGCGHQAIQLTHVTNTYANKVHSFYFPLPGEVCPIAGVLIEAIPPAGNKK